MQQPILKGNQMHQTKKTIGFFPQHFLLALSLGFGLLACAPSDSAPPTITITSPTSITLETSNSATIKIDANDTESGVALAQVTDEQGNVVATMTTAPFDIKLNFTPKDNGTHTYTIRVQDAYGYWSEPKTVTITVNLDGTAPTVSLASSATAFVKNGNSILSATASDNVGVTKVEFFENGSLMASDDTAPYEHALNYSDAQNGVHNYTAKAFDNSGNVGTSSAVVVNVDIDNTAPTVSLATNHEIVTRHGAVLLTATATDNKSVTKVELFENGSSTASQTNTAAPYEFNIKYNDSTDTKHSYMVKAYDANDNVANSAAVTINTNSTAPVILPLLASKNIVKRNGQITLSVDATDAAGITEVQFYEGNTQLVSVKAPTTGNTFTLPIQYNDATDIKHTYRAAALNAANNVASSDPIHVQTDSTAPIILLSPSQQNLIGQGPKSATILATPTEANGIANVQFFKDGNPIAADNGNPMQVLANFTESQNGTYAYTAKATDNAGNESELSAASNVNVDLDNTAPVISGFKSSSNLVKRDGSVTFTVSATDNKGINKIELLEGNNAPVALSQQSNGSYTATINYADTADTTHTYTVKAYDAAGNTSNGESVVVNTDSTAPTISNEHVNKILVKRDGNITITTNATDNKSISKVELLEGENAPIALNQQPDGSYAITIAYEDTVDTKHTYTVKAYDTVSNTSASNPIVVNTDSTLPAVTSLLSDKTVVARNNTVRITAQVSDANLDTVKLIEGDGSHANMVLQPDGSYLGTVTFADTADVAHSFSVEATDKAGNITANQAPSVIVNTDSTAPNAPALTSEITTVLAPGTVSLTATTTDTDVAGVEFFKDGVSIGIDTTSPYTLNAGIKSAGTFAFTAKTTDQVGNTSTASNAVSVVATQDTLPLSAGYAHSMAIDNYGNVWTWGWNAQGQLGDGTTDSKTTPTIISFPGISAGTTIVQLSAAVYHSLALDSDGQAWSWGVNTNGQLGNGTTYGNRTTPAKISFPGISAGTTIKQVTSSYYHSMALDSNGQLWAWGWNGYGQFGNGQTNNPNGTPTKISLAGLTPGATIAQIATSYEHSIALDSNGEVWTWGSNFNGMLGDGTTTRRLSPVKVVFPGLVTGATFKQIGTGLYHSMALDSSGQLWAWGENGFGNLANGNLVNKYVPAQVVFSGLSAGIKKFSTFGRHTLALDNNGDVWAWGYNSNGQLGDGTTIDKTSTAKIIFTGLTAPIKHISAGDTHSLAVDSNGDIWTWGNNSNGQLGDGTTAQKPTPMKINPLAP